MQKSAQLTLGLSLQDEATFDNFYPGQNAEIVAALKKTSSGRGERIIFLCGMRGQGCSHLLQACCHHAQKHQLSSVYLPFSHFLTFTPEILLGFELLDVVCMDDLHVVSGNRQWEEAIFHLYNRIHDNGGRIVMAANALPKTIQFHLPDLESRLSWGIVYQLHSLADEEKITALMRRANRRGLHLSEEVAKYILTHSSRHLSTLFFALDVLDKASLAEKRRLTIPFVKEVLRFPLARE